MTPDPHRLSVFALGLLAIATAIPAKAQSNEPTRERTGPQAVPAPLPEFATPPQNAPAPPEQAPFQAVPEPELGAARITAVHVASEGSGASAIPPVGWRPPAASGANITLHYREAQPLDANWVRSQFDAMLSDGTLHASSALAAVQLINRAYITAGFINSGLLVLPDSDLANGALHLRLVFGQLADDASEAIDVTWTGSRSGLTDQYIRARFPSARSRPFSAYELERDFRLLTEDEMIETISAALQPGMAPGQAGLKVIVDPVERFEFTSGFANDRSPSVGGEHGFLSGLMRSALFSGDTLTGEIGFTKGAEDGRLAYATPFLSPGTSLFAWAEFNNAAVIDRPLQPLDIKARERSAEIGFVQDLIRTPLMAGRTAGRWASSQDLSVGASVAHRKQKSFLLGEPFSFAPGAVNGRAEYTAVRLTVDYVRRNVDQVIGLSLTGTIGIRGTQSDIPFVPNPSDHFTSLRAQLSAAKRIGSGFELRARIIGQYAGGTLYSGERLAIGGVDSVRGYRESLYLTDRGVAGSLELAYPFSLSGRNRRPGRDLGAFTALIFADGAAFQNAERPRLERNAISSVGVSLAWNPTDALTASATYGKALQDVETTGEDDLQDRGFHFQVVLRPLRLLGRRETGR